MPTFLSPPTHNAVRSNRKSRTPDACIGSLSKDVFERCTSTGSEAFSLFMRLDTTKFVLLSFFSPIKTIYLRVSTKPQRNAAKSPLPVDVCLSKTLLLKLPMYWTAYVATGHPMGVCLILRNWIDVVLFFYSLKKIPRGFYFLSARSTDFEEKNIEGDLWTG